VILAFCCYGLVAKWPQVRPALGRLHWYSLAGSVAAAMAGAACMMAAWRRLLADLGSRLPVAVAARVTFVAQLGRYVPGGVWSFAAHVELGHDYDVPRRRGAAAVIVGLAVAVAAGLLIAAVSLPLASPAIARKYLLFLLAVPVIAVCLAPPILHRLLNFALKLIRQEPLEKPASWRGLGIVLAWTVLAWLLVGLQVWLLVADMTSDGPQSLLISVGAYALACSLALLLVIFPNGIGAREVILVAALAPVLSHGPALAVAVAARVVTTVSDLAWGTIGLGLARSARTRQSALASQTAQDIAAGRRGGRHRKAPAGHTTSPRPQAQPAVADHVTTPGPLPEVAA
jgi:uncharacterized membrane protein YbhN (UPF0104 family)